MTKKLGRFRLGPAKTRDGGDAEVLRIYPDQTFPLVGAVKNDDGEWEPASWTKVGKWDDGEQIKCDDLFPNAEPERVVFEGFGTDITKSFSSGYRETRIEFSTIDVLPYLIGKRCKVTVEVLDE